MRFAASSAVLNYTVWGILAVYMMRHLLLNIGRKTPTFVKLTVWCIGTLDIMTELSKYATSLDSCFSSDVEQFDLDRVNLATIDSNHVHYG